MPVHMSTCMYRGQNLTSGVSIMVHLILQHLSLHMGMAVLARLTGQPEGQTWKRAALLGLSIPLGWGGEVSELRFSCLPSKRLTYPLS